MIAPLYANFIWKQPILYLVVFQEVRVNCAVLAVCTSNQHLHQGTADCKHQPREIPASDCKEPGLYRVRHFWLFAKSHCQCLCTALVECLRARNSSCMCAVLMRDVAKSLKTNDEFYVFDFWVQTAKNILTQRVSRSDNGKQITLRFKNYLWSPRPNWSSTAACKNARCFHWPDMLAGCQNGFAPFLPDIVRVMLSWRWTPSRLQNWGYMMLQKLFSLSPAVQRLTSVRCLWAIHLPEIVFLILSHAKERQLLWWVRVLWWCVNDFRDRINALLISQKHGGGLSIHSLVAFACSSDYLAKMLFC